MHDNVLPDHLNFLTRLSEQSRLIVFSADVSANRIIYLNPFFEEVFGQQPNGVMDDPASLLAMIHPEDWDYAGVVYQRLLTPESGSRGILVELRIRRPDGSVRWLRLVSSVYEEENQRLSGILADVTDEKENHLLLNKFTTKKNALMEIVSHDLTRPFANIKGLSSLIKSSLDSDEKEEINQYLKQISWVCKQAVNLVRDYVNLEFMESVELNLLKKKVNIVPKLELLVGEYQEAQECIHKEFILKKESETINIELDDIKFMQALNNLLSNAIKFTHDKGAITVYVEEQGEHVLFSVADDGVGIPADLQKGLFEQPSRAKREGLKGEVSTGMGMSITKHIVEAHHGRIWCVSEENRGTTFYIELPK